MLRDFIIRLVQQSCNETQKPLYLLWNNLNFENSPEPQISPLLAYSFICSPDPIFETDEELLRPTSGTDTQRRFIPQQVPLLIEPTEVALPQWHLHPDLPTLETWITKDGFAYILLDKIPQAAVVANPEGLKHLEQIASDMRDVIQIDQMQSGASPHSQITEIFEDLSNC
ncbi:hypothetical protein ACQ4M3_20445 [Leptolyngbya sp. AN03gr2]|uniref:hypothetical protein n=1 Tax=unclassified Leptolyngbya TaxID=2650499 RepID=UPI003D31C2B3